MIIPKLPAYLTSLGGADYKGLIISLFTLTAMVSRPFSGKIADKVGRIPVMMFGAAVCVVMSLIYPFITSVAGFMLLRLVHGFSTGFTPTGLTAYVSDIIPAERRGEAMGLLGTAGSVGMSLGPSIGGAVANNFSLDVMFYCSSFFALASVLILVGTRETLQMRNRFGVKYLKIHKKEVIEPRVLMPCFVMLFYVYAYGTAFTIMQDFSAYVGLPNEGLPFTVMTVASLSVRLIAGKASDRYGRKEVLLVSMIVAAVGLTMLGLSTKPFHLLAAVAVYGLAHGMSSPTLFAWATDLSDPENRGKGISTLYIFMEMGIGIGALAGGAIYGNDSSNFLTAFFVCAFLTMVAFLYLVFLKSRSKRSVV